MEKEKNGIEIYTRGWCPYCRKAKAFFDSKGLSYIEYDIEEGNIQEEMVTRSDGRETVPQIFINDIHIGGYDDLIEKKDAGILNDLLGATDEDYTEKIWDLIIAGAGPAGLTAAVYAARKGLDTLILATDLGGQVLETDRIENYMARYNVKGSDLVHSFWDHANQYDVSSLIGEEIEKVSINNDLKIIETGKGKEFKTRTVIIATGTHKRHLGVAGENKLKGNGVHYCAICDGYMYAEKPVAIVGGGNSGLEASLDMAKLDSPVYLIEIADSLMGDESLQKQVRESEKIDIYTSNGIAEIKGEDKVDSVVIRHNDTGKVRQIDVDGVFVEIGLIPNSGLVDNLIAINDRSEIIINENNETNIEGIWAAGDVTDIKDKQIIVASAEGAKAALRVNEYLQ